MVLDGNSRFNLGGAQKVSLLVMEALQESCWIYLLETGRSSHFYESAKLFIQDSLLLSSIRGKKKITSSSYNLDLRDYFFGLAGMLTDIPRTFIFLMRYRIFPWNSVLYAASKPGILMGFIFRLFGYRLVIHLHTLDRKNHPLFVLFKLMARFSWRTLCTSQLVKSHFQLSNAEVLNPCIKEVSSHFKKYPSRPPYVLAVVSSLSLSKGISDAIHALKYLKDPDKYELWIVGEGRDRDHLVSMASSQVRFLGHLGDPERLMRTSIDLLLAPGREVESFGLVLVEAAAAGLPFITTNIGNTAILSQQLMKRVGVPPASPKAIADEIEDLFESPQKFESISKDLLSAVRPFSWQQFQHQARKFILP